VRYKSLNNILMVEFIYTATSQEKFPNTAYTETKHQLGCALKAAPHTKGGSQYKVICGHIMIDFIVIA